LSALKTMDIARRNAGKNGIDIMHASTRDENVHGILMRLRAANRTISRMGQQTEKFKYKLCDSIEYAHRPN